MKKYGFTLAETLITLVIIGAVAALTVPTMINNYIKISTSAKIKKAYSEVLQGIRLSQADNGTMSNWDWSNVGNDQQKNDEFIEKYLTKYFRATKCDPNTNKVCKYGGISSRNRDVRYILDNGTMLVFLPNNTKKILLMIVTSKLGSENRIGKFRHYFQIENDKVLPNGYMEGYTREDLLGSGVNVKGGIYACKKSPNNDDGTTNSLYTHGCTWLLYLDNWEFKDDYPW